MHSEVILHCWIVYYYSSGVIDVSVSRYLGLEVHIGI